MSEQHPPQHHHPPKKEGPGLIKILFFLLIFLAVGFVILNQMGVQIVETSEKVEMMDNPRSSRQSWDEFKERKDRHQSEKDKRTKVAGDRLHEFVQDYRETGNRDLKDADIRFLRKMDEKVQKESATIKTATQYYDFMKKSMKFYNTMNRFTGMMEKSANPVQYPQNQKETDRFINRVFSVEQEKLEIFTEGDPSPDEWLEFLEE